MFEIECTRVVLVKDLVIRLDGEQVEQLARAASALEAMCQSVVVPSGRAVELLAPARDLLNQIREMTQIQVEQVSTRRLLTAPAVDAQDPQPPRPAKARKPKTEPGKNGAHLLRDPDWLRTKYEEEGMTMHQIGQLVGRTESTVSNWCQKHGIQSRGPRQPHQPRSTQ